MARCLVVQCAPLHICSMLLVVLDFCNTTLGFRIRSHDLFTGIADSTRSRSCPNNSVSFAMDIDRQRLRSPPRARSVRDQTEALFNMRSLGNMKIWRALPMEDTENFAELRTRAKPIPFTSLSSRSILRYLEAKTLSLSGTCKMTCSECKQSRAMLRL